MSCNLSHTQIHYVRKFVLTLQLLKLLLLLMESGEIVDDSWIHVLHVMLNLQEGDNDLNLS